MVVQLQPTQGRTETASRPLRSCDSSDVIHIASDSTRFNFPSARTSLYKHKSPSVETIHTHTHSGSITYTDRASHFLLIEQILLDPLAALTR